MEAVFKGHPTATFDMTSTDVAQAITASELLSGASRPIGALITARAQDIKYAFGAAPVQGGMGHLFDVSITDPSVTLLSGSQCTLFQFISSANGVHGVLSITLFFESGKGA